VPPGYGYFANLDVAFIDLNSGTGSEVKNEDCAPNEEAGSNPTNRVT
jgi:hypothetical protein